VVPFGLAGSEEAMPPFVGDFKGLVIAGVPVSLKRTPLALVFGPPERPRPAESAQAFTERLETISFRLAAQAEAARQR
jgi:hypothetical protein